jgi:glucokinase
MYSAGIDLGGTFTKIALVASDGTILAQGRLPTVAHRSPAEAFAEVRIELEKMARATSVPYPPPGGCGIGAPGTVDYQSGRLGESGPLGWRNVELGAFASAALGCEPFVDIDVNAGALADLYFGCAREASEILYVSWGTGIGAALVVARKLYHSRGGAMGNFGHMPADPSSTRLCYCGCHGCLEIEAGGKAMADRARERLLTGEGSLLSQCQGKIAPERIAWAAGEGDPLAKEILDRSAVLMAWALAGVISFLNPEMVVFGGGVSHCFPVIQQVFDRELFRRTPSFSLPLTRITLSSFRENAGVVGAAMLPRDRMSP